MPEPATPRTRAHTTSLTEPRPRPTAALAAPAHGTPLTEPIPIVVPPPPFAEPTPNAPSAHGIPLTAPIPAAAPAQGGAPR